MRRIAGVIFIAALTVGCGSDEDTDGGAGGAGGAGGEGGYQEPGGVLGSARIGDVGQGYNSINRSIQPMYCVVPRQGTSWREVGGSSASISMSLESDRTKIARSLGLDTEISYGVVSAAASFYRETESDELSVSYVFGGTITFKDLQVGPDYEVSSHLVDVDAVDWQWICGDSYVERIQRGASVFTALEFHFASSLDKQSFKSQIKVAGGISASAALRAAQSVAKQNVNVAVRAVQVGGQVTQLSVMLAGSSSAMCSMGDIAHCLGVLDTIDRYVGSDLPKQFKDGAGRPLQGAALESVMATVGYETQPWTSLRIPNLAKLGDKPRARQLLQQFANQFSAQERIDVIVGMTNHVRRSAKMADAQRTILDGETLLIAENVAELHAAWSQCYPTATAGCDAAVAAAIANLQEPNPENLVPWFDMLYPDGRVGHPADRIDLDEDGHVDLCYKPVVGTTVECLMGVGQGWEEKATRNFDHGMVGLRYTPWAWVKLGGTAFDLAYCGPGNMNAPRLYCVPVIKGAPQGTITLERENATGQVTIQSTLDVSGINARGVFTEAARVINERYPGSWDAAK